MAKEKIEGKKEFQKEAQKPRDFIERVNPFEMPGVYQSVVKTLKFDVELLKQNPLIDGEFIL